MESHESHLESDASLRVLLPICGLLGGLALGLLRAWASGATDLHLISQVICGGILGSAMGMCAVLASAYPVSKVDLRSTKSLAIVVLVVALVTWFGLTLLSPLLSSR